MCRLLLRNCLSRARSSGTCPAPHTAVASIPPRCRRCRSHRRPSACPAGRPSGAMRSSPREAAALVQTWLRVSDSSQYIRWRAQYAARRLVLVKVDLPKGTGGLTGHHHASPSHDRAAHTGGWRRPLLRSVACGASVGSTDGVGAARESGWLVEEVRPTNRVIKRMDGHETQGKAIFFVAFVVFGLESHRTCTKYARAYFCFFFLFPCVFV